VQDEVGHLIPSATWKLQTKRIPEGLIFWLELESCEPEPNNGMGMMTAECELFVRQKERQFPCVFSKLVLK
jgi:hypothetical protein